jgi:hypothetical protein
MDHHGSAEVLTTQRYLLGELAGEEREQFESHFFSCDACAEEVRLTAAFVDNLKAVLGEDFARESAVSKPAEALSWTGWLSRLWSQPAFAAPAFAAVALAFLAGYQRFVEIPNLRESLEPRASVTRIVDPSSLRAQGVTIRATLSDAFVLVPFSLDPPAGARRVRFDFSRSSDSNAAVLYSQTVELSDIQGDAGILVSIPLPLDRVGSGVWHAAARAQQDSSGPWSDIVDRYEFVVELR